MSWLRACRHVGVERSDVLRIAVRTLDRRVIDRHGRAGAVLPALLATLAHASRQSEISRDRSVRRRRPSQSSTASQSAVTSSSSSSVRPCSSASAARACRRRANVSALSSSRTISRSHLRLGRIGRLRSAAVTCDLVLDLAHGLADGEVAPLAARSPASRPASARAPPRIRARHARAPARARAAGPAPARPAAARARHAACSRARAPCSPAPRPSRAAARSAAARPRATNPAPPHRVPHAASRSRATRDRRAATPHRAARARVHLRRTILDDHQRCFTLHDTLLLNFPRSRIASSTRDFGRSPLRCCATIRDSSTRNPIVDRNDRRSKAIACSTPISSHSSARLRASPEFLSSKSFKKSTTTEQQPSPTSPTSPTSPRNRNASAPKTIDLTNLRAALATIGDRPGSRCLHRSSASAVGSTRPDAV